MALPELSASFFLERSESTVENHSLSNSNLCLIVILLEESIKK